MSISKENYTTWSSLHFELQDLMKEELSMLREVLTSLKEEEKALIQHLEISQENSLDKRTSIHKQLKTTQKLRNQKTRELFKIFNKSFDQLSFNSEIFDELIAQDDDNASETLSLRDQILTIMKYIDQMKETLFFLSSGKASDSKVHPISRRKITKVQHQKLKTLDLHDSSSCEETN